MCVCVCSIGSESSSEICVLIAESNCAYASLKRRLHSLSPLPIRRHSCEWLLLSSSAENGEIRALTSNLFSNSIAPGAARNIHLRRLFNPRIGCQRHVFSRFDESKSIYMPLKWWNATFPANYLPFILLRKITMWQSAFLLDPEPLKVLQKSSQNDIRRNGWSYFHNFSLD